MLPLPTVLAQITTSLVFPSTEALVIYPRYTELLEFALTHVLDHAYLHADAPTAALPFPKVLLPRAYRQSAVLLLPSVLNARAYAPFAVLLLPFVLKLSAAYPLTAL